AKAAELLLRSGGFGMLVLDLSDGALAHDPSWQGRLLGLAREHASWLLLLSADAKHSLGPLVSLCIAPERRRIERGYFAIEPRVRKGKSGLLCALASEARRGPAGLL